MNGSLDVVVATDGSMDADRAVDWAAEEAMRRSGSLLIVSAFSPGIPGSDSFRAALDVVDLAADRARRRFPGLVVETKVLEGDPREALEDYQDRAALVVVGARGRNALRTVWLGSVSYWAARHLRVPAVIVRPLSGRHHKRGVAIGVDGRTAGTTLRVAFDMAAHRRCPLTIAHAWWDVESPEERWTAVEVSSVESDRRQLVDDMVQDVANDYPDVEYEVVFARGSVIAFLLELARSHDALVIGRRRTAPFDPAGLGTVATSVVEHAYGATVVVPAAAEATHEGR